MSFRKNILWVILIIVTTIILTISGSQNDALLKPEQPYQNHLPYPRKLCQKYSLEEHSCTQKAKGPFTTTTLQKAIDKMKPGDVLCVASGTWYIDQPLSITNEYFDPNKDDGSPLVIRPLNKDKPVVFKLFTSNAIRVIDVINSNQTQETMNVLFNDIIFETDKNLQWNEARSLFINQGNMATAFCNCDFEITVSSSLSNSKIDLHPNLMHHQIVVSNNKIPYHLPRWSPPESTVIFSQCQINIETQHNDIHQDLDFIVTFASSNGSRIKIEKSDFLLESSLTQNDDVQVSFCLNAPSCYVNENHFQFNTVPYGNLSEDNNIGVRGLLEASGEYKTNVVFTRNTIENAPLGIFMEMTSFSEWGFGPFYGYIVKHNKLIRGYRGVMIRLAEKHHLGVELEVSYNVFLDHYIALEFDADDSWYLKMEWSFLCHPKDIELDELGCLVKGPVDISHSFASAGSRSTLSITLSDFPSKNYIDLKTMTPSSLNVTVIDHSSSKNSSLLGEIEIEIRQLKNSLINETMTISNYEKQQVTKTWNNVIPKIVMDELGGDPEDAISSHYFLLGRNTEYQINGQFFLTTVSSYFDMDITKTLNVTEYSVSNVKYEDSVLHFDGWIGVDAHWKTTGFLGNLNVSFIHFTNNQNFEYLMNINDNVPADTAQHGMNIVLNVGASQLPSRIIDQSGEIKMALAFECLSYPSVSFTTSSFPVVVSQRNSSSESSSFDSFSGGTSSNFTSMALLVILLTALLTL